MLQHVFYKYPVSSGAVLDKNVGDGADDLPVLDDGAAAQGPVPVHFATALTAANMEMEKILFVNIQCCSE